MQQTKWQTDKDGFIEAIENDEYAELVLPNGDTLITDWEGDGVFFPYVVPTSEQTYEYQDEREAEILTGIYDLLGVTGEIEYDENNEVFVPYIDSPVPREEMSIKQPV